jgi:hypothetical protein
MSRKNKKNKGVSLNENETLNNVNAATEESESKSESVTEIEAESETEVLSETITETAEKSESKSETKQTRQENDQHTAEEMTELVAQKDNRKYSDDELEDMDAKRMAHVIMNDENRTDMDLLGEVFKDDAYSLKLKKKEAKKAAKEEKRKKSGETGGIRFLGTLSVLMAVAGIAIVLLTVYFLAIAPTYNKSEYLTHDLTFSDSAVLSQGDYTQVKEGYYVPELATDEDADTELGGDGLE